MKNYKDLPNPYICTGCAACENICPSSAIKMELNNDGFYKPVVIEDKCTSCGLCEKTCPVLHSEYTNSAQPDCYALMAQDEVRARSSSGGAFELIADYIFEKGGVVCGAAYTDDFHAVHHIIIDNKDGLKRIQGSKYIMSDVSGIYKEVKKNLQAGRYVLFGGVPCEVAALNAYLGKMRYDDHLLTVDLICHGIPSVKAFAKYMRDCHGNRPIEHLGFKDKEYGWHASTTIVFNENEIYNRPCETDDFYRSYLNGINKNSCCGSCQFAAIPRQGDITIGDYWGISRVNPEYNDRKGTSVVLLNSPKGVSIENELRARAKLFEPTPLQGAVNGNHNLVSSPKNHISRNQFFRNLDNRRYPDLVRWSFAANRFDVGIVGIPTFPNFGGALTYYALYRTLTDHGLKAALFSRPRSTGKAPIAPEKIYTQNPYDKGSLMLDYRDKKAMSSAGDICEAFVVGSDQLFNADLYKKFGEIVALDWISDNHRKVAYAASFGHNYFWGDEHLRAKMAHYMQKFDAFSVRETDAVPLTHNTFGVDSEWVLDPVFLCDKKHYVKLAEQAEDQSVKPHIFAYILDPDDNKDNILRTCSEHLDLPVELYSEILFNPTLAMLENEQKRFAYELRQGNVNERLHSLINSSFIVADSFHGVCFAIIFEIPFIAILNPLRGASRFYSVLGKLNLLDHLVVNNEELKQKLYLVSTDADFRSSMVVLEEERKRCTDWLINALYPEDPKKKALSDVDIFREELSVVNKDNQRRDIKLNALTRGYDFYSCRNIFTYVDMLKEKRRDLLILISVKDTPGHNLSPLIWRKLETLGLRKPLVDKHWHSYAAVIDGSNVIFEQLSIKDERVAYVGKAAGQDIKLVSRSYNQGNVSVVFINGIDYSENRRGLNFVIYDKVSAEVVDTVCFDTHSENYIYYRFGKPAHSIVDSCYKNEIIPADVREEKLPSDISPENADAYYCCQYAVSHRCGRKIVLWGNNPVFEDILHKYFNITPADIYNDILISELDALRGKQNEYFILVPNKKFRVEDAAALVKLGYAENKDFVYRFIRPIVIKNRDFGKEPYHDCFMNSITGEFSGVSNILLRGFNNKISFGKGTISAVKSELVLDCSQNVTASFGDKVNFNGKTNIVFIGGFCSNFKAGDFVRFDENKIYIFSVKHRSSVEIKNRVTFSNNSRIQCSSGKKLIIGEDCMFSIDVRIFCGDGHSLFDVKTGKNVNSVPELLTTRQSEIIFGNHVWVGIRSIILSGSIIGDGSVIGANALVKGVFPNNCSIGGNPAKLIRSNIAWSRKDSSTDINDCNKEYVRLTDNSPTDVV